MAIDSAWGNTHFHRNEIFSTMLKDAFRQELFASAWVNWLNDFTDGSNYKINSIGELTIDQAAEGTALPDRRPDSGQFVFNINEFVGTKVSLTDVFFEDDFMANQVLATIPERMRRAFDEYLETRVLRLHREQTNNGSNSINGAQHRLVANGTGRTLTTDDIRYAKYALKKAGVQASNLVAIVDPSVGFNIDVGATVTTSDNPRWEGLIETGIVTENRFIKSIYGVDIYESEFLDTVDAVEGSLTDYQGNTTASVVGDVANIFFSASNTMDLPFIGAWRRTPTIKSWEEESKGIEYHEMRARFGLGLYRPENLVTILSSRDLD